MRLPLLAPADLSDEQRDSTQPCAKKSEPTSAALWLSGMECSRVHGTRGFISGGWRAGLELE